MIVHDKSELKRLVRAAVRRAPGVDVFAPVRWANGPWGVDAMLRTWLPLPPEEEICADECFERRCIRGLPLDERAAETFSALSGMDMPLQSLSEARKKEAELGRMGYIRRCFECARVQKAFTPVDFIGAETLLPAMKAFAPEVEPILAVQAKDVPPERYGGQFLHATERICACMDTFSLRGIYYAMTGGDEEEALLRYCVFPLCEDRGAVLHLRGQKEQAGKIRALADSFPALRMIVDLNDARASLDVAGAWRNRLPCVGLDGLEAALAARGTGFVPFASAALQPGEMIGRWQNARSAVAQALTQKLLPLARTGFAIQSAPVENHVRMLMGGNVLALYEKGGQDDGEESGFYD